MEDHVPNRNDNINSATKKKNHVSVNTMMLNKLDHLSPLSVAAMFQENCLLLWGSKLHNEKSHNKCHSLKCVESVEKMEHSQNDLY